MANTATKNRILAELLRKCRSFTPPRHPPHFCSALHRLGLAMYDRDVIVDLSCIQELTAHNIRTLVAISDLLRTAGHRLILQAVADSLMTTLNSLGLTRSLNLLDACG